MLLTVSRSLKITLLQFGKRFFQHGFRASNTNFFARLFAYPSAPRRAKKICLWSVAKRRSSIQSMARAFLILSFHKLWSHLLSNRLINRRSKGTVLLSCSYQKPDKTEKSVQLCKECILRTVTPCAPSTRKPNCTEIPHEQFIIPCFIRLAYQSRNKQTKYATNKRRKRLCKR